MEGVMQINLAPETTEWLDAQVSAGIFTSVEEAIDACVGLARLREKLRASVSDPQRLDVDDVRSNLKTHFDGRRSQTAAE
jgi:Arc/MetJ-type ribon-helix-helix transcriptional regulator